MHPFRVRRRGLLSTLTTLAIHPGALGDLILFSRLLSRYPAVTLVASGEVGPLLVALGAVEACLDFQALPFHELFHDTPAPESSLAQRLPSATRLISCFPAPDNSAACARLGAVCGADNSAFLPIRPPSSFTGHLLDFWADLLGIPSFSSSPSSSPSSFSPSPSSPSSSSPSSSSSPLAVSPCSSSLRVLRGESLPPFPVPPAFLSLARVALESAGLDPSVPFLLIHPGAGSPSKCWSLDRYFSLADSAGPCFFILGPVEQDRWSSSAIDSISREFPTLEGPPLSTLAGLAVLARACVGNDSGFCHLAAAVGAPTLSLFGPTNPVHFAPTGPRAHTLAGPSMDAIALDPVLQILASLS
ncbi:MAG: hypothetical protein NTV86_08425 [Planctomycetota bacterium]|nr:hypothetical protein [Planctomycetota bacterium]